MAEERTERRRSPRYAVHGVRGWLTLHSEARVLNLSLTGMSVETVHPLEVGKGYTIRLAHGDLDLRLLDVVAAAALEDHDLNEIPGPLAAGGPARTRIPASARASESNAADPSRFAPRSNEIDSRALAFHPRAPRDRGRRACGAVLFQPRGSDCRAASIPAHGSSRSSARWK